MMHMSVSQWLKYVQNELSEEEREVYENHLYSCDQCLDLYLQAVAESEADVPTISNETMLVDTVMSEIEKEIAVIEKQDDHQSSAYVPNSPSFENTFATEQRARKTIQPQPNEKQRENVISFKQKQPNEKQPFYQRTSFHYLLATAMTLLLMVSGAFTSIVKLTDTVKEQGIQREQPSFTEGLLNKTFTLMDEIDEKLREETISQSEFKWKKTKEVGK